MPFVTIGTEINPNPNASLNVGQLPFDKVTLDFNGETVQVRPGQSCYVFAGPLSGDVTVTVYDAEEQVVTTFPATLSGTPTLLFDVLCDDGVCTKLSLKKLG